MVEKVNINCVDLHNTISSGDLIYCKVYTEEEIKDVEITYNNKGFPEQYSESAWKYAAKLAWEDFVKYFKLPKSVKKKIGEYNLDFKKLGVDPKGDYRDKLK